MAPVVRIAPARQPASPASSLFMPPAPRQVAASNRRFPALPQPEALRAAARCGLALLSLTRVWLRTLMRARRQQLPARRGG